MSFVTNILFISAALSFIALIKYYLKSSFDCGLAYTDGKPIGNKQCVKIDGNPVVVETAEKYYKMKYAAENDRVNLSINSGFRTYEEQEYFYNCYLTKSCNNGNLAMPPGYSNHENGLALDINYHGPNYEWLSSNASKFGFVRTVESEKWHWEYRPGSKCNYYVNYTCQ